MKRILYLAWGLFLTATLHAQTPCNSESFLKTFTSNSSVGIGMTLCASGDGNLYASGTEDNRTTLMKLTPDGDVIWSRSFSVDALLPCAISEMIVDSDGMLVAAGIQTTLNQANPMSLVFRYNPNTNNVLWSKTLAADSVTVDGVIEKEPGGNYIFYQTSFEPFTNGVRTEVLELNRLTGNIVPGLARRFTLNNAAGLARVVSYQGDLYAVGTAQTTPELTLRLRTLLTRLGGSNGLPVWANVTNAQTDVVGVDMLVDNDAILSLSSGAVITGSLNNAVSMYLQKNDLNGDLIWVKKYDFSEFSNVFAAEIVKLGSGYAIYGAATDDLALNQLLMLIDSDGNVQTTKRLSGFDQSAPLALRGEAIALDNHLFVAGTTAGENDIDWSILKTDATLTLNENCGFLQTAGGPQVQSITTTASPVTLLVSASSSPAVNRPITLSTSAVVSQETCSGCQTNCTVFQEQTVEFAPGSSVVVNGVVYTVPSTVVVTVPSTTGCDVITTYTIQFSTTVPPGSCEAKSFVKTFTNNSTFGVGLTVCAAGDGNLYASGMESNRTTLLKVTPNGEVIWSRSFELGATAAFAISEMIVDSEGMIVAAGVQASTQQANPASLVFRYNPNTNTVLWSKSFVADSITVTGVIEKSPGGNYVFYQSSFQPFTVGAGVQADVLEIDRATGNIVPALAQRYVLNNATGLARMISYQGALYAVGTTQTLPTSVISLRTLLMRLNATNGQPVWSNVSYGFEPTAEDYIGVDMLIDNGAIYSLSSSTYIQGGASTPVSIYLQKHDLNGNVLWMKKYDSPAFSNMMAAEIVKLGNGYVIYGAGTADLSVNQVLIQIDADGNVITTKGLGGFLQSASVALRGEAAVVDNHLFLAGTTADGTNSIDTDWSLQKTDSALDSDDCGYLRTLAPTQVQTIAGPYTVPVLLAASASTTPAVNQSVSFTDRSISSHLLCYECEFTGEITLTCDANISATTNAGESTTVVDYDLPTATTTCPAGGAITLTLLSGLPVGASFPVGVTTVCYLAQDQCGNTSTCCFQVTIAEGENSCDVKTNGCFRWELLPIKLNALGERRYRIKITNNCALDLDYVLFQVPNGITAEAPADGSIYTDAVSGRTYIVRNPNFSPYYSVRFKTNVGVVMNGGVFDILEYTLPQQSQPQYIHTTAKFKNGTTVDAFLNTFGCPILPYPLAPNPGEEARAGASLGQNLSLYPNPTSGKLLLDLGAWDQQSVKIDVLNAQGQLVQTFKMEASMGLQTIDLDGHLANGLYQLVVRPSEGTPVADQFIIQRD